MPKLSSRLPKYCKLKEYTVVYLHGKIHYLGDYGSPESKTAYARLVAESSANPVPYLPKAEESVSIEELAVAFLDHVKATQDDSGYTPCQIIIRDFLLRLYGKDTPVDNFKPSCLKLIRSEMVQSSRFCRNTVNRHTQRIVSIFEWGVENELVQETTWRALTAVKSLPEGAPGTFDHPEREDVPDSVIKATLPHMPPTLQAMVKVQRLTGMRPSEVFNMRVGEIDRHTDPDLWLYRLPHHKTQKKTKRKKVVPLGKPEQELIVPYLEGKRPEEAVFSPRTAMAERKAANRANRKTKLTPSQEARDAAQAAKPTRYREFYNKDSYRQAVEYAVQRGNKTLPDGEKIPRWTPYQLRHAASSAMEVEVGFDESQALLDHATPNTTARYNHRRLEKQKELARNRRNPFDTETEPEAE